MTKTSTPEGLSTNNTIQIPSNTSPGHGTTIPQTLRQKWEVPSMKMSNTPHLSLDCP